MAWQEKKPESSRTVGKIYRWFEKKWLIEQHTEKINQQLFCMVQEKNVQTVLLDSNKYILHVIHIHTYA